MARRSVLLALAAAVVAVIVIVAVGGRGSGERTFRAELRTARGLNAGVEVRLFGAPAGSVKSLELTDWGTAMVTVKLDDGVPAPRADAAVAVSPADLLGSYYLSYSPGAGPQALDGAIPVSRTSNLARFTDLLKAFGPLKSRAGLQALLVELSIGLEKRGVDLNRASVELRPALAATDQLMHELASQNASLRSLIDDSGRVARQLAHHDHDLDGMLASLAQTLRATTGHSAALDRGLQRSAPAVAQLRETAGRLASAAVAARPLASALGSVAPGLTHAMVGLGPFLTQARQASIQVRPTLRRARRLLSAGNSTFAGLNAGLGALQGTAPELDGLMETLRQVSPLVSDALFVKVAGQTNEPGNQPLDPTTDPLMHLWRGAAVPSCESFGVKIRPGCLQDYIRARLAQLRPRRGTRGGAPARLPRLPKPGVVGKLLDNPAPDQLPVAKAAPVKQLLDYLLAP